MPRAQSLVAQASPEARRPQARRPRHGLGQGPLCGTRPQGPEVALGLAHDARRLRGRSDAALHAARQAARRDVEGRDADRAVPHPTPRRQRPRPRARVRRRQRGDAGVAEGDAPDPLAPHRREDPRRGRADEEAHRLGARLLEDGAREDRGRRRDGDAAPRAEAEEAEARQEGRPELCGRRPGRRRRPTAAEPRRTQSPRQTPSRADADRSRRREP